jgi:predicted transposase/invertase (TIGR01784 family)
MRTDHLFYKLFTTFPDTLFALAGAPTPAPGSYRFDSVEVKETALRIDGVFVPTLPAQPHYFIEVQFQRDEEIYWRLFTEVLLYLRESAPQGDWRVVLVFARRSLDVPLPAALRSLGADARVQRVYLEELSLPEDAPLGLSLARLVVEDEETFPQQARRLIERTREQMPEGEGRRRALEFIEIMIVYKLQYSPEEIRAMFTMDELEQTPYMQGRKAEIRREAEREAERRKALSLVLRLLTRQVGALEAEVVERISQIPDARLDELAEALLDFEAAADLQQWLDSQAKD